MNSIDFRLAFEKNNNPKYDFKKWEDQSQNITTCLVHGKIWQKRITGAKLITLNMSKVRVRNIFLEKNFSLATDRSGQLLRRR